MMEVTAQPFVAVLQHLTKPFDLVEADEDAPQESEGLVDVSAPLVADGEPPVGGQPGDRSLNYRSYNGAKFPNAGEVPTGLSPQASEVALGR